MDVNDGTITGSEEDDIDSKITLKQDVKEPLSALAFKIATDPFV